MYQVVVVSTGPKYWQVKVPGAMVNDKWNNIGIRWNPNLELDSDGNAKSGGLTVRTLS